MIKMIITIKEEENNENFKRVSAEFDVKGTFATEGEKRVCKEFEKRLKTDEKEQHLYNINKDELKKQLKELLEGL